MDVKDKKAILNTIPENSVTFTLICLIANGNCCTGDGNCEGVTIDDLYDAYLLLNKAKSEVWEEVKGELRSIPSWYNKEHEYGEYDLQPLGSDMTSEQGAYMAVREIMNLNPYKTVEDK